MFNSRSILIRVDELTPEQHKNKSREDYQNYGMIYISLERPGGSYNISHEDYHEFKRRYGIQLRVKRFWWNWYDRFLPWRKCQLMIHHDDLKISREVVKCFKFQYHDCSRYIPGWIFLKEPAECEKIMKKPD